MIPDDLKYTSDHEWVRFVGDGEQIARVGITYFAQDSLGDIVFVQLPEVGTAVDAGQAFGEVESTKSVSDLLAPLAGEVVTRNELLDANPELVNSDPYGDGWIVEIRLGDGADAGVLLDAKAYGDIVSAG